MLIQLEKAVVCAGVELHGISSILSSLFLPSRVDEVAQKALGILKLQSLADRLNMHLLLGLQLPQFT